MRMRRTRSEWVNSEISVARASLSVTCEVLGWRVRSFLNLSGKQPLCHFEIGFSYLWNVEGVAPLARYPGDCNPHRHEGERDPRASVVIGRSQER